MTTPPRDLRSFVWGGPYRVLTSPGVTGSRTSLDVSHLEQVVHRRHVPTDDPALRPHVRDFLRVSDADRRALAFGRFSEECRQPEEAFPGERRFHAYIDKHPAANRAFMAFGIGLVLFCGVVLGMLFR